MVISQRKDEDGDARAGWNGKSASLREGCGSKAILKIGLTERANERASVKRRIEKEKQV